MKKATDKQKTKELFEQQIKEKMEIIQNNELDCIPSSVLPETFSLDYYFVSYSHKDYKQVYLDIFHLQFGGLNIWYDRGIPAGKDWKEVAQRNITPFECKGVILYVSENSLTSKAVFDEIQYVQEIGKQFVCITLPFENDYLYKGESVKGKYFSILEMIGILKTNGALSAGKARQLKSLFSEETIFLPFKTLLETKVEKIRLFTPATPLLEGYIEEYDANKNEYAFYITSIHDRLVSKITRQDFLDLITHLGGDPSGTYFLVFEKTSLANCPFLERIELADNLEVNGVGEYAFANDENFVGFARNEPIECYIFAGGFYQCKSLANSFSIICNDVGDDAFSGCEKIKEIDLAYAEKRIGNNAFRNCKSLTRVAIPVRVKEIGEHAFSGCDSLEKIALPKDIKEIKDGTFANCESLTKIVLGDGVEAIGRSAFKGCKSLKEITLGKNIKTVGPRAFQFCHALQFNVYENINYLGSADNPYLLAHSIQIRYGRATKLHEDCKILHARIFDNFSRIHKTFTLPNGVLQIGEAAFRRSSLSSINLSDGVLDIGEEAFQECSYLQEVAIPASIKHLGKHVFQDSESLKEITYRGSKEQWRKLFDEMLIGYDDAQDAKDDYQYIETIHCQDGDIKREELFPNVVS